MSAAEDSTGVTRGIVFAAVLAGLVVLVGAVVVIVVRLSSTAAVLLEPVAEAGPDPFTDSLAVREVAEFNEIVQSAHEKTAASFESLGETRPTIALGTTPGLYGGSNNERVCNTAALAAFLAENDDKAGAWANVFELEAAEIDNYLRTLTPVILSFDTLVTNHGFHRGSAVARQSVLQAGTAVLVDQFGAPRVRCGCGNPLLDPRIDQLDTQDTVGTGWEGYGVHSTVIVSSVPDQAVELEVTDLVTGELRPQPIGSAVGQTLVATHAVDTYDSVRGGVQVSSDGATWTQVLDSTPLYDVAAGDDLLVAVGSADGSAAGVVHYSQDGTSWSDPIDVVDPLRSVAYGDGVWVAVGDRSFSEYSGAGDGNGGAIYRSTDGRSWNRVLETDPYDNTAFTDPSQFRYQGMLSVGYGNGQWLAVAQECLVESHCVLAQFISSDGLNWQRSTLDGTLTRIDVAHDGERWAMVGGELTGQSQVSVGEPGFGTPVAGTTESLGAWTIGEISSDESVLRGLTAAPAGWFATELVTYDPDNEPEPSDIFFSEDLQEWEVVGQGAPGVTGLAMLSASTELPESPTVVGSIEAGAAALLELHGEHFELRDENDEQLGRVGYEESSDTALAALTEHLGEPETEFVPGDNTCVAETNVYLWGDLRLAAPTTPDSPWNLSAAASGRAAETVTVQTPSGIGLGSSRAEVQAVHGDGPTESGSWDGNDYESMVLEPADDSEDQNPHGVRVQLTNGVVTWITSRSYLFDMC